MKSSEEGGKKNLTRRTLKLDCFKEGRLLLLHFSQPKNKGTLQNITYYITKIQIEFKIAN